MPFYLTDTEWVLVVLAAIYLFESFFWVRREAVCFSTLWGSFRVLNSPPFMGNQRYKLVAGFPFPLNRTFICERWPFAISPEGIVPYEWSAESGNADLRCVGYEAIAAGLTVVEKEVRIEEVAIAVCSSAEQAKRLAEMLAEIAASDEAQRGDAIIKQLDRWTDRTAAAERLAEVMRMSTSLRWSAFNLFVLAFLLGPALYFCPWHVPVLSVALYFAMAIMLWAFTVWDYGSSRKQLLGETFSQRFRHAGILLVSPGSAMRSGESLFRFALAAYHPLTAAAVLCSKPRLQDIARVMLLAIEHPLASEVPADPAAARVDAWFRKKVSKRLGNALRQAEVDTGVLLQPPKPFDDSKSYCPRCHSQFVMAEGTCADCSGIPLVPYVSGTPRLQQDNDKPSLPAD